MNVARSKPRGSRARPAPVVPKPRVIKVSLAIAQPDIDWARAQAESSGASLSAFVSESLAQRRRAEAWATLRDEQLGRPLTAAELARAERAWKA